MTETQATVAVIGAGGKMGQRISNNLARSDYRILYAENSPKGQEYITGLGRELTESPKIAEVCLYRIGTMTRLERQEVAETFEPKVSLDLGVDPGGCHT